MYQLLGAQLLVAFSDCFLEQQQPKLPLDASCLHRSVTKVGLCSKNRTCKRALNFDPLHVYMISSSPDDELSETKGDKCHSYVKSRGVDTDMCCFPVTQKSSEVFTAFR
jgi:hypothetical protein